MMKKWESVEMSIRITKMVCFAYYYFIFIFSIITLLSLICHKLLMINICLSA